MPISNNIWRGKPASAERMAREVTAMCEGEDISGKNGESGGYGILLVADPENPSKKIFTTRRRGVHPLWQLL